MRLITLSDLPVPFTFDAGSAVTHGFPVLVKGRPFVPDTTYRQVATPHIPTSSRGIIQDWYVTPMPEGYVIPLFLHVPRERFSEYDAYHTVTASDTIRPDLIAYKYYGTVDYFWLILLANNIIDPYTLTIGSILRIPSPETVINQWINPV
jgi:hypothetical protein